MIEFYSGLIKPDEILLIHTLSFEGSVANFNIPA